MVKVKPLVSFFLLTDYIKIDYCGVFCSFSLLCSPSLNWVTCTLKHLKLCVFIHFISDVVTRAIIRAISSYVVYWGTIMCVSYLPFLLQTERFMNILHNVNHCHVRMTEIYFTYSLRGSYQCESRCNNTRVTHTHWERPERTQSQCWW